MISSNFLKRHKVNVELTYKCSLVCPACPRQTSWKDKNKKLVGEELSLESYTKLARYFKRIILCGQLSDPLHHSQFHEILKITNDHNVPELAIHTAVSLPSMDFYKESFKLRPNNTQWVFGIDGLPKDSHKYRINQDGEKLFNVMVECAKSVTKPPIWQYIVFSYNEKDMEEAEDIARKNGIRIQFLHSARWNTWRSNTSPIEFKPTIGPKVVISKKSDVSNTTTTTTTTRPDSVINYDAPLPIPYLNTSKKSALKPDCFEHRPFGTDAWGRLLPCCMADDHGNYDEFMYKKLVEVSKISDHDSIEDIIFSEPWQIFLANLEENEGLSHCHEVCSVDSTPNNIILENGNKVL